MKNKGNVLIIIVIAICSIMAIIGGFLFFKFASVSVDNVVEQAFDNKNLVSKLHSMRTNYIADNSNVSKIISYLTFPKEFKYTGIELENSDNSPKTIKIIFSASQNDEKLTKDMKSNLSYNSMIIFSLIENCEQIQFLLNKNGELYVLESRHRQWANSVVNSDPFLKTQSFESFEEFISTIDAVDFSQIPMQSNNLEESISNAIIEFNKERFYTGEFATQGHITLGTDVEGTKTTAYVYQSYAQFQFENKIFERCSGVVSPVSISFTKDKYGNYKLFEYHEAKEGNMYDVSLQELFPENIIEQIQLYNSNESQLEGINNQIITSVKDYLKEINREDAKIALNYQEKHYPPLSSQNSEIYDILYKAYSDFPYYVGSIEKINNHIRYEFVTDYQKDEQADIFTYKKTNLNSGSVEEQVKIQIKNGELSALEGKVREDFYKFKKSYDEDRKKAQEFNNQQTQNQTQTQNP